MSEAGEPWFLPSEVPGYCVLTILTISLPPLLPSAPRSRPPRFLAAPAGGAVSSETSSLLQLPALAMTAAPRLLRSSSCTGHPGRSKNPVDVAHTSSERPAADALPSVERTPIGDPPS